MKELTYKVTLDGDESLEVKADYVDVLDGPSRCVRFTSQESDDELVVARIYFGVKGIELVSPVKKTKQLPAKRGAKK